GAPCEASESCLMTKSLARRVLETQAEHAVRQATEESSTADGTAATDGTQFEARDQAPPKEEKPKPEPKKRGRKPKGEREQWLKDKAEKGANLPLYEKKIEAQLDVRLAESRSEVPQDPTWRVTTNSQGKRVS